MKIKKEIKNETLCLRVDTLIMKKLRSLANANKCSVAHVIRTVLAESLKSQK